MPSFMMEIEAAQRPPLDQLAMDYFQAHRPEKPSLEFCRRLCGLPDDDDAAVAKRLSVAIAKVRDWRRTGRGWSCR